MNSMTVLNNIGIIEPQAIAAGFSNDQCVITPKQNGGHRMLFMKMIRTLSIAALAVGFMAIAATTARADDCVALGGTTLAGECQISGPVARTGTYNLDETLHILGTGRIDASHINELGITINICVAPAAPSSTCDLILDKPTAVGGGQIEANDTGASGNGGGPVTINVSRNVLMQAGSAILANNTGDGGRAGDINIKAGGDMTMCAAAGAQAGCGGASANNGAKVEATNLPTTNNFGGNITITIGNASTATGRFYMEGGDTTYGEETGARIDATSAAGTGAAKSGNITITPFGSYFTEPGSVVESGGHSGTATQQGGKIFIVSGCNLTTEGRVTSKGPDSGADLVHLEGCEVIIRGLVESTGKGHAANAPNSCDNVDDELVGEVFRVGKPANATGCIEVWGNYISIDATNGWTGELNADIGNGGASGMGWIDIFGYSSVTVTDGTGNDRISNNLGHTYFSTYAVHANAIDGSDGTPGVVTAKVKSGSLTASGLAFEASSTMTAATGHPVQPVPGSGQFVGNGSDGGTVDLEASGAVTLDTASINASGDFFGGSPCPTGSGACGNGGHIVVSAWGAGSNISWQSGSGDVRTNNSGGAIVGGDINLNAGGGSINTNLTDFHGETAILSFIVDATKPDIPVYNSAPDGSGPPIVIFNQTVWALCGASSISGRKYDSITNEGLSGWEIHLFNASGSVHMTQTTGVGGNYTFINVPTGTYTICEKLQAGWVQTFPATGANCTTPSDPAGDNATPGPVGYTVDLTTGACCGGQQITGKDFGNDPQPPLVTCPEDADKAARLTRTVNLSKPNGSGGGVAGNPKNYWTVQAAYDAAKVSPQAEIVGIFAETTENVVLDGSKTLTITQCTCAKITAANNSLPVWNITSTGKLTIIGPDSVGGTVGWQVGGNGYHDLKAVRAYNASVNGILITSSRNSVSWNEVSNNGSYTSTSSGVRVQGNLNTVKGGTVGGTNKGPNKGDGVQLVGNSNQLSGANILNNIGNGVFVSGSSNTVKSNGRINFNTKNGILVTGSTNTIQSNSSESNKGNAWNGIHVSAGSGNLLQDNKMQSNGQAGFNIAAGIGTRLKSNGNQNNAGNEFTIGSGNTDQGGNKKNGSGFTFTGAGGNFN